MQTIQKTPLFIILITVHIKVLYCCRRQSDLKHNLLPLHLHKDIYQTNIDHKKETTMKFADIFKEKALLQRQLFLRLKEVCMHKNEAYHVRILANYPANKALF